MCQHIHFRIDMPKQNCLQSIFVFTTRNNWVFSTWPWLTFVSRPLINKLKSTDPSAALQVDPASFFHYEHCLFIPRFCFLLFSQLPIHKINKSSVALFLLLSLFTEVKKKERTISSSCNHCL